MKITTYKYMRHALFIGGLVSMAVLFSRCSSSSSGSTAAGDLSTAAKITSGLGTATTTLQSMGTALSNGGSAFSVGSGTHTLSAATSCTIHGDPGTDVDVDGTVEDSERFYASDYRYALQKVYCTLVSDTDGPESVSGAVRLVKTIACAVEKQLGSITFDGTAVPVSGITITTECATADMLQNMNNGTPTTSLTLSIPSTITASKNIASDISEFPNNTHYSHAIKIASNDGTSLKFIILAKFDDTVEGDPIESGDFEFATYGTGTEMQGSAIEYTAGKIDRTSSAAGTLWYESRHNRIKSSLADPICNPGVASSSCGFARHSRIRTDISFSGGDISDVSNMTAVMSEGYSSTGSGQSSDQSFIITATGNLTSGLTGKSWLNNTNVSPASLDSTSVLNAVSGTFAVFDSGVESCIIGAGSITSGTGCSAAPAAHTPSGTTAAFFLPPNDATWLDYLSANGGLGFTTSATLGDIQSGL